MPDGVIVGTNIQPTNPTPLSAPQEQQVRDLYYKNVRNKCATEIQSFAQCVLGRTLTMIYACRSQRLAMNACMLRYQNQDERDAARQEWFALAEDRQRQRDEHAQRLQDARQKHKEWWGLDTREDEPSQLRDQKKEEKGDGGGGGGRMK